MSCKKESKSFWLRHSCQDGFVTVKSNNRVYAQTDGISKHNSQGKCHRVLIASKINSTICINRQFLEHFCRPFFKTCIESAHQSIKPLLNCSLQKNWRLESLKMSSCSTKILGRAKKSRLVLFMSRPNQSLHFKLFFLQPNWSRRPVETFLRVYFPQSKPVSILRRKKNTFASRGRDKSEQW